MGTLMLTKQYDKASPMLKMALYTNKKLGDVQFAVRRTIDGASSDYLVAKLTETTVMSYNMHVSPYENGGVEDTFELAYKTIEVEYDGGDPQTMNVATELADTGIAVEDQVRRYPASKTVGGPTFARTASSTICRA